MDNPKNSGDLMRCDTDINSRPLCVDLDGTLVRTHTLVESLFALPK